MYRQTRVILGNYGCCYRIVNPVVTRAATAKLSKYWRQIIYTVKESGAESFEFQGLAANVPEKLAHLLKRLSQERTRAKQGKIIQVGEQLPALVDNLTNEEVTAFALFLKSVESLEDPAPCVLLDEEVLIQELQANPALAALELGMPSFEWNENDRTPCQRAQDLLASMVHKISIAR